MERAKNPRPSASTSLILPDATSAAPGDPAAQPVLYRVDGHALLANAKAMQLAGVSASIADPSGGRILRDASGAPAGVFIDNAMGLIGKAIPPASDEPPPMHA